MPGLRLCICRPAVCRGGLQRHQRASASAHRNKWGTPPPAAQQRAARWTDRILSCSRVYKRLHLLVRELLASDTLSEGINRTEKDAPQGWILPPQRWRAAGACLLPRERPEIRFFFSSLGETCGDISMVCLPYTPRKCSLCCEICAVKLVCSIKSRPLLRKKQV